jgi:hypothetical protein
VESASASEENVLLGGFSFQFLFCLWTFPADTIASLWTRMIILWFTEIPTNCDRRRGGGGGKEEARAYIDRESQVVNCQHPITILSVNNCATTLTCIF